MIQLNNDLAKPLLVNRPALSIGLLYLLEPKFDDKFLRKSFYFEYIEKL